MTGPRVALRGEFEAGILAKHDFARRMSVLHLALLDYAELLVGTDVAAIHIEANRVVVESRLEDVRFPCDPSDRGIPPVVAMNFRSYEAKDFEMVRRLVPAGGTFLDVGANIGWYSLHVAAHDPAASVVAFEPVPTSFRWLRDAVALNHLANVECHQAAVGDHVGELVLYLDRSIAGAASAAPSDPATATEPVRCAQVTLDSFVADRGVHVDFLKLDVEGGELAVLRGATRVLSAHRPIVLAEMLRKLAKPFGYHPNDIIALMREHGYGCYFATVDGRLHDFTTMDESTTETNFYFLHGEAHTSVVRRLRAVTP